MKERILEFLKAENKTSAQLAEEIGVQPSGISHILSGRNNPSLDFVLKMLEKYNFISTDWLLFGKGNMYKEPGMQSLFDESIDFGHQPSVNQDDNENKLIEKEIQAASREIRMADMKNVEKIVLFYDDKSFREYHPGNE
jgi:transcriptional regulator with XRE-family HTH domain